MAVQVEVVAHDVPVRYRWDGGPTVDVEVNGVTVAGFDLRPVIARALEMHGCALSAAEVELMLVEAIWRAG